ncbi:hypothetical protein HYFRA_00009145 [Hymenoscyphus fraxineus]|uniref:Uncharacterized protein n=1 Tax=Hymenoscyphus fraxineus TaxID=746836 RepID=A0A9N9KXQ8_9HELO|nr:hypothetical protein HYFRA_00009145 [Hymenoscyphus fraxineus]
MPHQQTQTVDGTQSSCTEICSMAPIRDDPLRRCKKPAEAFGRPERQLMGQETRTETLFGSLLERGCGYLDLALRRVVSTNGMSAFCTEDFEAQEVLSDSYGPTAPAIDCRWVLRKHETLETPFSDTEYLVYPSVSDLASHVSPYLATLGGVWTLQQAASGTTQQHGQRNSPAIHELCFPAAHPPQV